MFDVLLSLSISFTITFLAIPVIINVAEMKKLFDMPDARKIHQVAITPLGGIGIFAGFVFGCLLTINFKYSSEFQYFIAATMVIFFLGLKDDILVLIANKKIHWPGAGCLPDHILWQDTDPEYAWFFWDS